MVTRRLSCFNLRQIARSGQCFRMTELEAEAEVKAETDAKPEAEVQAETKVEAEAVPMIFRVISGSRLLTVTQAGETVTFYCGEEEFPYWENYFDLQTDYGRFIESVDKRDRYLQKAAAFGSGIRILRQDPWEMIITFVISQQKTIPAIRTLVERLSERYGSRFTAGDVTYYGFPTPLQLSQASSADLRELKLGYRAEYIARICRDVCSGALDLEKLKTCDYPAAFSYLQRFYGIGEKVANCVCLFGLHHIDAFPVDTWIRRILMERYACRCRKSTLSGVPRARQCEFLVKKYFSGYKGYAGVMQQYLFYYERNAVPR